MKKLIQDLLKQSMRDKIQINTNLYRSLLTDITTAEKTGKSFEVIDILVKALKKREDAYNMYRSAGRIDLAEIESKEASLIEDILPVPPSEDEIWEEIKHLCQTYTQMGIVIKMIKTKFPLVDGKWLADAVKSYLVGL